ncbi:hypothetical protein GLOIN_2v1783702 [Rhizophagus clarus]|uniref:Uncharacterized protein n=1 Tax=Rhizophagus clarus TaxID=94130 RepID=A0A8H3R3K7_9GLOM|nr:hypothetical protein GLOIN_2v1783702 [Rhizophagus clarus]
MIEQIRKYCPICGLALAKPRRGLSTIEFQRTVHGCTDIDSLHESIYKLIKIFRCVSQNDELTFAFTQDYEYQLEFYDFSIPEEFELIKIWLLKQINGLDRDVGEKALYQLLFDLYAEEGINEPFAVFYDIYYDRVNNPLSKNFVSCALRALGLVTKMSRIVVNGREKSIISINATREELLELFRKNGIDY